jgi:hypothetical protein
VHQRLALLEKETVNHIHYCALSDGAPDSPVHPANREGWELPNEAPNREGWELPNEAPTTPRPFGTIKGTPMRLQQEYKSSQQVHTSFGSILSLPLLCISLVCVEAKL